MSDHYDYQDNWVSNTKSNIIGWVVGLSIVWLVIAVFASMVNTTNYSATYPAQYGASLGVKQGVAYPLEIGGSISGQISQWQSTTYFGLFGGGTQSSGSSQPEAAVQLGVYRNGAHYIVTIPYNEVQFIVSSSAPSSATITYNSDSVDTVPDGHRCWVSVLPWHCDEYGPLSVQHDQNGTYAQVHSENLSDFLQKNISNVRLVVTPAEYHHYLYG